MTKSNLLISIVLYCILVVKCSALEHNSQFANLKFPGNISVDLPYDWQVVSSKQRALIKTYVESKESMAGLQQPASNYFFSAHYLDDSGKLKATFNLRYWPLLQVTQKDVEGLSDKEVLLFDKERKDEMLSYIGKTGIPLSIIKWYGTEKRSINGTIVMITEYLRAPEPDSIDNFMVRMARVLNGSKSFTITISYAESGKFQLAPVTDKILQSIIVR